MEGEWPKIKEIFRKIFRNRSCQFRNFWSELENNLDQKNNHWDIEIEINQNHDSNTLNCLAS